MTFFLLTMPAILLDDVATHVNTSFKLSFQVRKHQVYFSF